MASPEFGRGWWWTLETAKGAASVTIGVVRKASSPLFERLRLLETNPQRRLLPLVHAPRVSVSDFAAQPMTCINISSL